MACYSYDVKSYYVEYVNVGMLITYSINISAALVLTCTSIMPPFITIRYLELDKDNKCSYNHNDNNVHSVLWIHNGYTMVHAGFHSI